MIEHDHTSIAEGTALRAYSMERPRRRWPVLIRQMTYDLPEDRSCLRAIQRALWDGQDLRPNEDSDRRYALAPANL